MHKTMAEEGRMAKEGDRKPGNMTAIHDKLLYAEWRKAEEEVDPKLFI